MKTGYRMNGGRWLVALGGLLAVAIAVWQLHEAVRGLEVVRLRSSTPPLVLIRPEGAPYGERPVVLVAHGIAGSDVIMRGFAYTLAHAGYAVALWDFDGHGANPRSFPSSGGGEALLENAEAALAAAEARAWGDPGRVAIVGHSMGSGVASSFGLAHPDTAATIAVSPTGQRVTPTLPRNLLLMAGRLEGRFVRSAEQRLVEAGGAGGDVAAGTARKLVIVPGVEHLTILFSPTAHAAALEWLDATFGAQPGAIPYTDRRVLWYGIGLLGTLTVAGALAPLVKGRADRPIPAVRRSRGWRLAASLAGGVGATLILWLAGQAGLQLGSLLGLVVGGYLLAWFAVAGALTLLLLWIRPPRPTGRALLGTAVAFAALWLGMGLLGGSVWLPWWLIPRRLSLWPLGALLLLPWFLAAGLAVAGAGPAGRVGWWLAHSAVVAGSAVLAFSLSPELGFLLLILPIFPLVLAAHALVAGSYRNPWPFALSGAIFTSWLLLAVFPLV